MTFTEWLDSQDWSQIATVVICGLGSDGQRARAVRERTKALIMAYEPREEIRKLFTPVDNCLVSASATMLRGRLYLAKHDLSGDMLLVSDSDDPPEFIADFEHANAEAELSNQMRDVSVVHTAHLRVENMLASLDRLVEFLPINHLANCLEKVPAIVVGAGPSLDKNIAAIKQFRDRCVVFAVNTSWPALHAAGITPDFVVCCESKPVGPTLAGLPVERVIFIPGIHVHPDTLALPWRRVAPALSPEGMFGEWACRLFGLPTAPIGPSAVCLGVGLGWLLGCDPIILAGCDCAPSEDGRLYSDKAAFGGTTVEHLPGQGSRITKSASKMAIEDLGPKVSQWIDATVETWSWDRSHKIQSVMIYDSIRQWLEEFGERASRHRRCVNATEGGAHILHWEHLPLAGVLEPLARVSWRHEDQRELSCPDMVCAALDIAAEGAPSMKVALDEALLAQSESQLRAQVLAREAVRLCIEGQRITQRLSEIQGEIGKLGNLELLDAYNWGRVEQARKRQNGERPVFEVFREVFAEGERGICELNPLIQATRDRIHG